LKLMHGKLSPFVRKAMIFAIEKGLEKDLEVVPAAVGQAKINEDMLRLNPTGKIPTLITNAGESVYDSLVICDYLDSLAAEPRAIPLDQVQRTQALTMNAAADGLVVAGVLSGLERAKAPEKQWPEFEANQSAKVERCLAALDRASRARGDVFDVGTVGALCALGWADSRAPHLGWREKYPQMAVWADAYEKRDSVARTRPPAA
jgi:glutathione S-transferase